MSIFIAEDKIAEIKNTADIIGIISEYVVLKKTGKNYLGLCPFHSEKTPSFTVSLEKQIFHCFGCGEGGNVFTFLMKKDGLTFPEAVRQIGRKVGIEIPEKRNKHQRGHTDEKEVIYNINRQAMKFFQENLHAGKAGEAARSYLKARGIKNDIIREFCLGYVPEGWSHLLNYFTRKEVSRHLLEKAGLIVSRKDKEGYYDRFRNRIIFPIFDMTQRVIGFGGRVMDESLPKYLNSPETPVYNKSNSMYGLHKAKQSCRDTETVYIAEGYFDLIALYQHGIHNAVATLGTSLTAEHVQLLRNRYIGKNGKVVLVYDSDVAGIKAAQRSLEIFKQGYVNAKILILPDGYDPDAYLFKFGRDLFLENAANALSAMSFIIDSAVHQHGLTIEGKMCVVADVVSHLAMIEDEVVRSLYVKELAERLSIEESAIARKIHDTNTQTGRQERSRTHDNATANPDPGRKMGSVAKENRLEQYIISMMLQFPNMLEEIKKREVLNHFRDKKLKSIGGMIIQTMGQHGGGIPELLDAIDDMEYRNIITALAIGDDVWNREGCLKLIRQFESSRNRFKNDLLLQIKAAEDTHDDKLLLELLKEKQAKANTYKHDLESLGGKSK